MSITAEEREALKNEIRAEIMAEVHQAIHAALDIHVNGPSPTVAASLIPVPPQHNHGSFIFTPEAMIPVPNANAAAQPWFSPTTVRWPGQP